MREGGGVRGLVRLLQVVTAVVMVSIVTATEEGDVKASLDQLEEDVDDGELEKVPQEGTFDELQDKLNQLENPSYLDLSAIDQFLPGVRDGLGMNG